MATDRAAETAVDYLEGLFSRAMSGRSVRDVPEAFGAVRAEVARLRATLAKQAPEGWVTVPKLPTTQMRRAGAGILRSWDFADEAWRLMLAAAPPPPATTGNAP